MVAMWLRSYWTIDMVRTPMGGIDSTGGRVIGVILPWDERNPHYWHWSASRCDDSHDGAAGPLFLWKTLPSGAYVFKLPYVAIVLLIAVGIFPYMQAVRRARSRWKHDQCHVCGYHLRCNTSGTCPECGTEIRSESAPDFRYARLATSIARVLRLPAAASLFLGAGLILVLLIVRIHVQHYVDGGWSARAAWQVFSSSFRDGLTERIIVHAAILPVAWMVSKLLSRPSASSN
jgi:hypothetical protein